MLTLVAVAALDLAVVARFGTVLGEMAHWDVSVHRQ